MATNTPVETGKELTTLDQVDITRMLKILTNMDITLNGANAKVKTLPKIVDEATKLQHFAVRDKLAEAKAKYNAERMPYTRKLNSIIKLYTSNEAEFDRLIDILQKNADTWTRTELQKARAAQDAEDARVAAEKNKIALEGRIKELVYERIEAMLDNVRTATGDMVQNVTKETFEDSKKKLSTTPKWNADKAEKFLLDPPSWITDKAHFATTVATHIPAAKEDYLTKSAQIMKDSLAVLEVALHNKDEAKALQDSQKEADRLKAEQKATMDSLIVEGQQALVEADKVVVDTPKARVKMKIDILDPLEAWPQIFMFWFSHDPKVKTEEDLSKKTLLQMKTFCEKSANDGNEALVHKSIEWVEEVKAK